MRHRMWAAGLVGLLVLSVSGGIAGARPGAAGPHDLTGIVTDSIDARPQVAVETRRWSGSAWVDPHRTTTNSVGRFTFANLPAGEWGVRLTYTEQQASPVSQAQLVGGGSYGWPSAPRAANLFDVGASDVDLGRLEFRPATVPFKVALRNGAAQINRTYTASPEFANDDPWIQPSNTRSTYQWYRGSIMFDPKKPTTPFKTPCTTGCTASQERFVAIRGARAHTFKVRPVDRRHRLMVEIRVTDRTTGELRGTKWSAPTNFVLRNLTKPVMPLNVLVGSPVTAKLGNWPIDWTGGRCTSSPPYGGCTTVTWRRDNNPITGHNNVRMRVNGTSETYTPTAADGGTGLSILTIATFTYPNGVKAIDRVAQFARVRFPTTLTFSASSPAKGQLKVVPKMTIRYGNVNTVTPVIKVYDGAKYLGGVPLTNGTGSKVFKGVAAGTRHIKLLLTSTSLYQGKTARRDITVR